MALPGSTLGFVVAAPTTQLPLSADVLSELPYNSTDTGALKILIPDNQMQGRTPPTTTTAPSMCILSPPDHFENVVVPSIYIVICIVGLLGNGVVLGLLLRPDHSHIHGNKPSVTNILVINLALADFIFVGALPFWITERFLRGSWIFGNFGCKFLSFISLLNLYGSVFFLVAMGIDRYLAVVFAVRARNYRTPRNAIRVCIGIWLFASIIAAQALVYREICVNGDVSRCLWHLPGGDAYQIAYFVTRTALGFFLPVFVIIYCYSFIIISLRRRSRNMSASGVRITNQQQKVTRLILAVVSLFVVCWLPNHIVTVINALTLHDIELQYKLHLPTASLISTCLAYANSSINPVLYALMKEDVRLQLIELIRKTCGCAKKENPNRLPSQPHKPSEEDEQRRQATLDALNRRREDKVETVLPPSDDANDTLLDSTGSPYPAQRTSDDQLSAESKQPIDTMVISNESPAITKAATHV
nr:somatostatin receptor type 5 [Ciona intestinalis]|eukprot:XP_009858736.1 somatostatin receptor type 5 [Ciona intestinalis]